MKAHRIFFYIDYFYSFTKKLSYGELQDFHSTLAGSCHTAHT